MLPNLYHLVRGGAAPVGPKASFNNLTPDVKKVIAHQAENKQEVALEFFVGALSTGYVYFKVTSSLHDGSNMYRECRTNNAFKDFVRNVTGRMFQLFYNELTQKLFGREPSLDELLQAQSFDHHDENHVHIMFDKDFVAGTRLEVENELVPMVKSTINAYKNSKLDERAQRDFVLKQFPRAYWGENKITNFEVIEFENYVGKTDAEMPGWDSQAFAVTHYTISDWKHIYRSMGA